MNDGSRFSFKELWRPDLTQTARGFFMGGADIIPGVSGGTVALILGIYERLIHAISRFDMVLVNLLRRREFREAVRHVDFHFLYSLGLGVALGIVGLATTMHFLLEHQMQYTFAVFTGLIFASSVLVARVVPDWNAATVSALLLGCVGAFILVGQPLLQNPPDGLLYIFACGAFGICAMILPGISGAFILLIMGKYLEVTGLIKDFMRLQISVDGILIVVVFCLGMAVGLIGFSKFLKMLLARHSAVTMAVLCGFMLGSLRKLWPFKIDRTPLEPKFKLKVFENTWPLELDQGFWLTLILAALAAGLVLSLDRMTRGRDQDGAMSSTPSG